MNDQMFRDLVALIIIGVVLVIAGTGHQVDPQIKEWADVAFGFLFGFKTAGYVIGKDNTPPPPAPPAPTTGAAT
jgi:hypothetical protein